MTCGLSGSACSRLVALMAGPRKAALEDPLLSIGCVQGPPAQHAAAAAQWGGAARAWSATHRCPSMTWVRAHCCCSTSPSGMCYVALCSQRKG